MSHVVVIGGGVGGMLAALRARKGGADVTLIEARSQLGGLASPLTIDDTVFDGGPYILLDRVRLAWALNQVGIEIGAIDMVELDPAYRMRLPGAGDILIQSDLDESVRSIEAVQPGAGETYRRFVDRASVALEQMAPMLVRPHHPREPFVTGAWRAGLWAALSLNQVLRRHGLNGAVADVIRVWTYIAGGDPARAPGPLSLVPALIHRDGAARPVGGIHQVIDLIAKSLEPAGVSVVINTPVSSIRHDKSGVRGVTTADGTRIDADIVISDIGGAAALLDLVDVKPPLSIRMRMAGPLQSPGVSAYLKVRGTPSSEINFEVSGSPKQATAFIAGPPTKADPSLRASRMIAPLSHERAQELGVDGQKRLLEEMVLATWWRDEVTDAEVVATRLVGDWGREFRLRDQAMNLVMARRQLLLGRLPHRIDHIPGLFLAGSWTHPGQWISFCSVSGVLAADQAMREA